MGPCKTFQTTPSSGNSEGTTQPPSRTFVFQLIYTLIFVYLFLLALPNGVSLRQIYIDFMLYLLNNTRAYIRDYETDGANTWKKYWSSMDIAIAHPNGWGIKEQGFLRDTVVATGYCSYEDSTKQIHFVSEAEASIYHCLEYAKFDVLKVSYTSISRHHFLNSLQAWSRVCRL